MKWAMRMIGLITGFSIFAATIYVLNYMYMACDDEWERILWHSFYEDKGKIDNIYLGSSHVFCDLDPYKLDQLNGQYNFNLASSGQLMNGTYYLLKEADQWNDLSHVYVELFYIYNIYDNFNADEDMMDTHTSHNWKNTDNMRLSLNKLQYMITMADPEKYPNIFWGFSRYRSHLDDWSYVETTIAKKKSKEYIDYQYHNDWDDGIGYDEYRKKGRFFSTREYPSKERMYYQDRILVENPIAETSEAYLRKVISYCQTRGITITLFISPIYELQLISTEQYDNYLNQVKEIAAEYEIEIYDFNLTKEVYLPIQEPRYFRDVGHLNSAGADLYTDFFHKIMSCNATENQKYFYDTYAQKLAQTEPEVYGIYYQYEPPVDDGTVPYRNMFIASNRNNGMEYKIVMTPEENKDQYLIQDFNENKTFKVTLEEHGMCTIAYRMNDAPDAVKSIEIAY